MKKRKSRSAKTGKYVTKKYAKENPDVTVAETGGVSEFDRGELIELIASIQCQLDEALAILGD